MAGEKLTLSYETVFVFETLIQTLRLCQKIKSSIFLPTFFAVRYFRQQEPGAPLSMCFITPLWFEGDWRGSHLFTSHLSCLLLYLLPCIQVCTPSLRVVLLTVPSLLWIDSSVARILYWGGWWESLVKVLHSHVMWRRKQESISLQVFGPFAHSQTCPVGPEQGARQGPHSDPMGMSLLITWLWVTSFPVRTA